MTYLSVIILFNEFVFSEMNLYSPKWICILRNEFVFSEMTFAFSERNDDPNLKEHVQVY